MKSMKNVLWIFTAAAVIVLGTTAPLYAFHLEKNELSVGVETTSATSQDDELDGYTIAVPYLILEFESELSDTTAFTMDSQADFTLEKYSIDEEAANAVNVETEPSLEWSPWEELTLREVMAVSFSNEKPGEKNADRETTTELTSRTELEYSTMDDELHGLSSWDLFQRGFTVTGGYHHQLYMEEAGEKADDLDRAIGIEAEYSYLNEEIYFMVTPSVSLLKHLNSTVDESLEIEAKIDLVKDVNQWLTVGIYVDMSSIKEDPDADFESETELGGRAIVTQWKDLKIFTKLGYIRNISDSESDPAYTATIGMEYDLFY
jgi:hypothetical protein